MFSQKQGISWQPEPVSASIEVSFLSLKDVKSLSCKCYLCKVLACKLDKIGLCIILLRM